MCALGYAAAPMILDAANHGVPQHRSRLFIVLTRSEHPIELKLPEREHVPASSIIDFGSGKWSQIERPGRSSATLARIRAGRDDCGKRFVMSYYGQTRTGRTLNRPIGTITTRDRWAVVDGDRMRMISVNEARRAMAFREDYVLPENKRLAMHLLGNAVCPPVARDVVAALMQAA